MKLITLNTWAGRIRSIREFLASHSDDVDIFCFQEIFKGDTNWGSEDLTNIDDANQHLFEDIEKILPNHKGLFCPVHKDIYGISIFIKKNAAILGLGDIVIFENNNFPDPTNPNADRSRKMQWIKFKKDNEEFLLMNVHGHWTGQGKSDTAERIKQSEIIAEFIKNNSMPSKKILCGDFNLRPDTKSSEIIEAQLKNLIKEYKINSTRTELYTKSEKYADYIYVSLDIKVNSFSVLSDAVSDHAPLFLDFD